MIVEYCWTKKCFARWSRSHWPVTVSLPENAATVC